MDLLNFWQSFFGININSMDRYIDEMRNIFPFSKSQIWGKKEAVWVDVHDAWKLYIEIPELRAVIDKRAQMMASNHPCLYDAQGNKVESHWLLSLIDKPNAVQSWADVVYSLSVQDGLYNNAFAYAPARMAGIRNLIVPLPADKVKMHLSGKRLKQMDAEDLVDKFTFVYDTGDKEDILWEDMLYFITDDGMNIIKPVSRIETLRYPLSNIKAQYHKRNVLLENIGAIGILSAENSDMAGTIPMTPEEKQKIRNDWYRRSKDELIITEAKVDWTPMSYPTKDLMLFEELTADKMALFDAYGLNANIFSSDKGATFTNVRDSIRMIYTDTIIPETQSMYDSMMRQWGLHDQGYYLKAEFDHLPIMQDDEVSAQQVIKTKAEAYSMMLRDGVISKQQYADEFGITLEAIDKSQAQAEGLINAQTQLRGTIGGLDGIIALNTAVGVGQISREVAIATLVNYYGYDSGIAQQMITQPAQSSAQNV
jgi:hypothetical protein